MIVYDISWGPFYGEYDEYEELVFYRQEEDPGPESTS